MKRALFFMCGLCWIAFGIIAGALAVIFLTANTGADNFLLDLFTPVPATGLLALIHFMGFCVLSLFCFLIGIGFCSGFFETSNDDAHTIRNGRHQV